ncbi:uncharacterized protein LOC143910762 [Arctopsyche grandis]|uniref:uncharacterized protein LOC143910762 n=1 Tax=Arctopsyche grandis TaxID=121162 RepID=UPI00406D7594
MVEALRTTRKLLRSWLTRNANELEGDLNISMLRTRLEAITPLLSEFETVQAQINELDQVEVQASESTVDTFKTDYTVTLERCMEMLRLRELQMSVSPTEVATSILSTAPHSNSAIQLPHQELPTFDGDAQKCPGVSCSDISCSGGVSPSEHDYKLPCVCLICKVGNRKDICSSNFHGDVGAYGRNSDGGIFDKSNLAKSLEENKLNIPEDNPLVPGTEPLPYVIVADEAFPLKRDIDVANAAAVGNLAVASTSSGPTSLYTVPRDLFAQNLSETASSTSSTRLDDLVIEAEADNPDETDIHEQLEGRRIVDIKYLFSALSKIKHEHTNCTLSDLNFVKEIRKGFLSEYVFRCRMCLAKETVYSEDPKLQVSANTAFVEGIVCTGNGYSQLNEICGVINMPCMSRGTYTSIEQHLAPTIEECAFDEMIVAGEEEKRLAILNGDIDEEGYPLLTVIADGSWAKRSYKSGFSSLSGAACIVGLRTKKVLYLGVRNSYCCICARATKLNIDATEHKYFKNWRDSANAMEADIIAEGFLKSMEMHGVKFNKLVGDGDSSIMKKLMHLMPYGPNIIIQKIECKNHLLRNFCNKLKALGKKTNNNKGYVPVQIRKKVESNVLRMRKAIVGAIHFRKEEENTTQNEKIKNLRMDIKNSANHVFGDHVNCAAYFCKPEKNTDHLNIVNELQACGIWTDIQQYLLSLAGNADSLILDVTNNSVEQFNNVIAKFIGGKRVNFTARGSYQARCFGAVTSWNSDIATHSRIQKKIQGHSPGRYTKQFIGRKRALGQNRERIRNRKLTYDEVKTSKKRKVTGPDENYGQLEIEPDMADEVFQKKKEEFLRDLNLSQSKKNELERSTVDQSDNRLWAVERRKRLTASNFGKICKLRPKTSAKGVLKSLLYSVFKGNIATNYGKESESEAIKKFKEKTGLEVSPCGLFIDVNKSFLAASPDGLISEDGLIEVKCPYNIMNMTPEEGIRQKKLIFGQLHITGRDYCYFVVWSSTGMIFERIEKDDTFWLKMEQRLENFYDQCLLPEIIDGRIPKNLPVRERSLISEDV